MNKYINKMQIIFLWGCILLFSFQIIFLLYKNNHLNEKTYVVQKESKDIVMEDVYSQLQSIKNKRIVNAQKEHDGWIVNVEIAGEKEEIINEIYELKEYEIINYTITYKEGINNIRLKLLFEN